MSSSVTRTEYWILQLTTLAIAIALFGVNISLFIHSDSRFDAIDNKWYTRFDAIDNKWYTLQMDMRAEMREFHNEMKEIRNEIQDIKMDMKEIKLNQAWLERTKMDKEVGHE